MGLFASGASNGGIVVWDYEMSKVEGVCKQHKREVVCLRFLDKYPVLVSTSNDGLMCIWGVRGCNSSLLYKCIGKIMNVYIEYFGPSSINIRSIAALISAKNVSENSKIKRTKEQALTVNELRDIYSKCISDEDGKNLSTDKIEFIVKKSEEKNSREYSYLMSGDEKGNLRVFNFTPLFTEFGIKPSEICWRDQRISYNPMRKEDIDVSGQMRIE